jgi:hypothetical protein
MKPFTRNDTTPRARAMWAKSIERLIAEIDRPEPLYRHFRRLYRKDVARACIPALTEVRWVLIEQETSVRPEAMARLRGFMTDGGLSPLYRDDVEKARRASHELASAFVVPAAAHAAKPAREFDIRVAAGSVRA